MLDHSKKRAWWIIILSSHNRGGIALAVKFFVKCKNRKNQRYNGENSCNTVKLPWYNWRGSGKSIREQESNEEEHSNHDANKKSPSWLVEPFREPNSGINIHWSAPCLFFWTQLKLNVKIMDSTFLACLVYVCQIRLNRLRYELNSIAKVSGNLAFTIR